MDGFIFPVLILVFFLFLYFRNNPNISDKGKKLKTSVLNLKKLTIDKNKFFGNQQIKIIDEVSNNFDYPLKRIMFRARFIDFSKSMNVSFVISAFDITNGLGQKKPVLSFIDLAQEPNSNCYQMSGNIGFIKERMSITDWIQIGEIVPKFIQPPHSGFREINVVIRMFDTSNPPTIFRGVCTGKGNVVLEKVVSFTHNFTSMGYDDGSHSREESLEISLKIGVFVAMSDGTLDDAEGQVLKNWIINEVSSLTKVKQKKLKKLLNQSFKDGYSGLRDGSLSLSKLVSRLAEIGEKKTKYDAVELCLDIMASDGIADPKEMLVIRSIAKKLNLDMNEIEKMREKITLNFSTKFGSEDGLESLVGLLPNWSKEQKLKHLRSEFQKWSNRLNSFPEGELRHNAQNILDNIAILRKKYS